MNMLDIFKSIIVLEDTVMVLKDKAEQVSDIIDDLTLQMHQKDDSLDDLLDEEE